MRSGERNAAVLAERVEDYDAAVQTMVPSLSLEEREGTH
jgi:hypothetical protein